ncbi:endoribonuclease L-PSP family protein, partial [Ochromonadaceae sp. CCMP2298]
VVHSDRAPRAVGPYSQAVKLPTGLVFLSGSVGLDPATGSLVPGGVEAQALQALQNMHAIVQAAGGGLGSVVKTLVLLADMGDYAKVNKVYADFFAQQGVASFPARSAFAVSALPLGALVEIEAVAAL